MKGIAKMTRLSTEAVVGSLHRLWSWADARTQDGVVKYHDGSDLDKKVGKKGFAKAMEKVGWLELFDDYVRFPSFDVHMSKSAKKRASNTKIKETSREKENNRGDKSVTKVRQKGDSLVTNEGQMCDQRKNREREENTSKEKEQKKAQPTGSLPAQEKLDELISSWNSLGTDYANSRARPGTEAVIAGWKKVQSTPALKAGFEDIPELMERIRAGKFLHCEKWFKLTWLFGKKNYEWNVLKILDGNYEQNDTRQNGLGKTDKDPTRQTSDPSVHDLFRNPR